MPCFSRISLTSTALVLLAPAAFADLSAEDVWSDWKTYISGFGYTIEGQETETGDGLTVNGITIQSGDDTGTARIAIDRIVLSEQSDGSVTIRLPAIMPMEMSTPNNTGGSTRVSMDYRQTGLNITASGSPEMMQYDYEAQEISLLSTGFEVNGEVLPPESNSVTISMENLSGRTDMVLDSQRRYDQTLQAAAVRYALNAQDEASNTRTEVSGQTQAVTFAGKSTMPLRTVDTSDLDAMLAAGFTADGIFGFAANAMNIAVKSPTSPTEISVTAGQGTVGVDLGDDGLTYEIAQNDLQTEMTMSQFPLPISFGVARSEFDLSLPLRKSDTPEDFGLGVTLDGFTMSDVLWGMFDPTGQLPRDPATLAVDLAGKARLLFDFLDPAETAALSPDTAPVEVERLDLNRLQLSAMGTELKGQGGFAFDNSGVGAPKPEGAVDLTLTGGNALINKLVEIGLLPEQQAMGARMMMGLLAVPGDGPDTLNSKIEINQQGHVLANGQRIQ